MCFSLIVVVVDGKPANECLRILVTLNLVVIPQQHVAQLLEEVGSALGDDDVDDAAASRQGGIYGDRARDNVRERTVRPDPADLSPQRPTPQHRDP